VAADIASSPVLTVEPEDDLHTALRRFTQKNIDDIPVVDPEHKNQILGMLSRRDVITAYHDKVTELQREVEELTERPV
jgi:CIC family chloride channel protein